jgi:CBS domain-containing protein
MKPLSQILKNKTNQLINIHPEATVYDALNKMMEHNISAILILKDNQLKGIFTERDYARKIVLQGKSSKEIKLEEVMTANLITVRPDDSVDSCMEIMTEKHIRHLPVVNNNELVGMISIGDLVKFVIEDQKQTIENLESYIRS